MLATSLELATKYDYLAEKFQKSFEWLKKRMAAMTSARVPLR